MGKPVTANGLFFDPITGKAILLYNKRPLLAEQAVVEVGYNRKKGAKSLIRANTNPNLLYPHPNRVLEQYDLLLAVDTNWKDLNGERIALTSIVFGRNTKTKIPGHTSIQIAAKECFEYRNPICKPENLGWQQVIVMLQRNPDYHSRMIIALIVDSDLDMLNSYNRRLKPIIEGFYLPNNFELIYASADSPSESVANKMIALADSLSSNLLKQIVEGNDPSNLAKIDNQPFSFFRRWELP